MRARRSMADGFVGFCLRHSRALLFLWTAVLAFSAGAVGRRLCSKDPLIDNSVGVWFMRDDPELAAYEKYNDAFGRGEWNLLLLKTASIYDPDFMRDLAQITRRMEGLEHVQGVVSIADTPGPAVGGAGGREYAPLYPGEDGVLRMDPAQAKAFKKRLWEDAILEGGLFHRDDPTRTVVLFRNDNLLRDPGPYRMQLVDAVRRIVRDYPRVTGSALAGTTVVNAELNRASQGDVVKFYVLVTLFIVGTGYLLLGGLKDLAVLLSVVVASVLPPMAALALFHLPYNMVTVMLPPLLITLSVCDVIHVINAYHYERRSAEPRRAVLSGVGKIWTPCFWTSLITALGFLSLASSTVLPIRELGLLACMGIVLAWLVTMSLVPVLLVLFWPERAQAADSGDGAKATGLYAKRLLPFLDGKWRRLWLGLAVLSLLTLPGVFKLKVDTDYTKFFGPGADLTRSYGEIRDAHFGQNPVAVVLSYPTGESFRSKVQWDSLLKFEKALGRDTRVVKLLPVGDGPGDFVAPNGRQVQMMALTNAMGSGGLEEFKRDVQALGRGILPRDVGVRAEGTAVLWANMDGQISRTQMGSIAIIGVVFLVLMPLIFRSLKFG
ncbi:MAG TPA: MMPL family transporter, partial [bacterium]|nr:MMPL family transporter [bacterium]